MPRVFVLAIVLAVAACRTVPVAGACTGSRELRCLTAPVCVYDRDRGCMECRCGEANARPDRRPEDGARPVAPPADPIRP